MIQTLKNIYQKNKDKVCKNKKATFLMNEYIEYPNTKIKHLSKQEVEKYLSGNVIKKLQFCKN